MASAWPPFPVHVAPPRPPALQKGDLIFDCNFESGNMGKVTMVSEFEYDVSIRPDTNNPRYRLWFYFSISNQRAGQKVILTITNFSKSKSLYRVGMGPCIRKGQNGKWDRLEKQSSYYRSHRHKKNYVLSFPFTFESEDEPYYFAYCFPYTYTDLQHYLYKLERKGSPFLKRDLVTRTVQGRRLDLLTITNPQTPGQPEKDKKTIFVTARVHPGETPASFICHGLIDFLVSNHPAAVALREHVIFKIIPMLNPDGVFIGNYRSSSMGFDLNRHWLHPESWSQPTIWATRQLLIKLGRDRKNRLDFFVDIHAHSTATNGFLFVNVVDDETKRELELAYPRALDGVTKDFAMDYLKFCRDPSKVGTGRRALGEFFTSAPHCYTMEISFYCQVDNRSRTTPYTEAMYCELGKKMALAYVDHYKIPVSYNLGFSSIHAGLPEKYQQRLTAASSPGGSIGGLHSSSSFSSSLLLASGGAAAAGLRGFAGSRSPTFPLRGAGSSVITSPVQSSSSSSSSSSIPASSENAASSASASISAPQPPKDPAGSTLLNAVNLGLSGQIHPTVRNDFIETLRQQVSALGLGGTLGMLNSGSSNNNSSLPSPSHSSSSAQSSLSASSASGGSLAMAKKALGPFNFDSFPGVPKPQR